jgi:hypothetical protein
LKVIQSENTNIISDICLGCNGFKNFIHKTARCGKNFSTVLFYVQKYNWKAVDIEKNVEKVSTARNVSFINGQAV